jgi:hypothetical protein
MHPITSLPESEDPLRNVRPCSAKHQTVSNNANVPHTGPLSEHLSTMLNPCPDQEPVFGRAAQMTTTP